MPSVKLIVTDNWESKDSVALHVYEQRLFQWGSRFIKIRLDLRTAEQYDKKGETVLLYDVRVWNPDKESWSYLLDGGRNTPGAASNLFEELIGYAVRMIDGE